MKREVRVKKIQKAKLFSQNEASQLTGFTRGQLVKWDETGIVKPYRHPCILYNWKQVVFLRILFYWRQKASFQKIVKVFSSDDNNSRIFFENLQKSSIAVLNDQKLVLINDSYHEDSLTISLIAKTLKTKNNIEVVDIDEVMPGIFLLNIGAILYNLKKAGDELKIENFRLKIDEEFQNHNYDFKVAEKILS